MKNTIKYILQQLLGFHTYLKVFARYKIRTLRLDRKERDFFHFLSLLKDGKGDVLDIGANIGIMTVHLAKHLPNQQVHAFEPIPENSSVLTKIVQDFALPNVVIHTYALGETNGELEMVLPLDGKTKMQGLSHVKHESITEWNEGHSYTVGVKRLDDITFQQTIQGIKIDVENFEYFVLSGGKMLIQEHQPCIYAELWDNDNRKQCEALLASLGYTQHVVKKHTIMPYRPGLDLSQNFIFISNNVRG